MSTKSKPAAGGIRSAGSDHYAPEKHNTIVPIPTPLMAKVLADRRVCGLIDDAGRIFRRNPEVARALLHAAKIERLLEVAAHRREVRGVRHG